MNLDEADQSLQDGYYDTVRIKVPGKTFVLGEYAVLVGAPALVCAHEPSYEFEFSQQLKDDFVSLKEFFHPLSPAGIYFQKFCERHHGDFSQWGVRFKNPYEQGGFGTSTAEFLAVKHILSHRFSTRVDLFEDTDVKNLLEEYGAVFDLQGMRRPSGVDLLSQMKGGFCFVDKNAGSIRRIPWMLANHSYYFLPTGLKLKTHEHLQNLNEFDSAHLVTTLNRGLSAFENNDETEFVAQINNYHQELMRLGFVAKETVALREKILEWPGVVAVKGCGAMGADVVMVVVKKENEAAMLEVCDRQGLKTYHDLAGGCQWL